MNVERKIDPSKIESGVIFDIGPGSGEGLIGVGTAGRPTGERIAFTQSSHSRVCVTGENDLLWLSGSSDFQQLRCGRRIVFERDVKDKSRVAAWTSLREYLRVLTLASIPDHYVIRYEPEGEEKKEEWVGTYSPDFKRRIDIAGKLPEWPTDQHILEHYSDTEGAVLVEPLIAREVWFRRLKHAKSF